MVGLAWLPAVCEKCFTCVIAKIRFYKNEKNEPILKSSQTLDFTVK